MRLLSLRSLGSGNRFNAAFYPLMRPSNDKYTRQKQFTNKLVSEEDKGIQERNCKNKIYHSLIITGKGSDVFFYNSDVIV